MLSLLVSFQFLFPMSLSVAYIPNIDGKASTSCAHTSTAYNFHLRVNLYDAIVSYKKMYSFMDYMLSLLLNRFVDLLYNHLITCKTVLAIQLHFIKYV